MSLCSHKPTGSLSCHPISFCLLWTDRANYSRYSIQIFMDYFTAWWTEPVMEMQPRKWGVLWPCHSHGCGDILLFSQMALEFYRKSVTSLITSDKQRMLSLPSALCYTLHDSGRRQSSILTSHPLGGILWTEVLGLKSRVLAPIGSWCCQDWMCLMQEGS